MVEQGAFGEERNIATQKIELSIVRDQPACRDAVIVQQCRNGAGESAGDAMEELRDTSVERNEVEWLIVLSDVDECAPEGSRLRSEDDSFVDSPPLDTARPSKVHLLFNRCGSTQSYGVHMLTGDNRFDEHTLVTAREVGAPLVTGTTKSLRLLGWLSFVSSLLWLGGIGSMLGVAWGLIGVFARGRVTEWPVRGLRLCIAGVVLGCLGLIAAIALYLS
jgi:hypothetical protein